MAVSVVVSNFNGEKYLPRLLETLRTQEAVTLEIIVVDRNSTDSSKAILSQHPDVKIVTEPPESGLVAGYAIGVPQAQYEHFFFCNEDMWFAKNCLALLENEMNKYVTTGAVMPIQLTYDGRGVVNGGHWFRRCLWHGPNCYPFRISEQRALSAPDFVSGINAGACLLRRTIYEKVGGWDTSFFLDYEDTDLSVRLWQQGFDCRIVPAALVYHAVGASNAKPLNRGRFIVNDKRYIWALSNEMVVGIKTFTGLPLFIAPVLVWLHRILRDMTKLRFRHAMLDLRSFAVTLKRLKEVFRYRSKNRDWLQKRPGQRWYDDPRFVANTKKNG